MTKNTQFVAEFDYNLEALQSIKEELKTMDLSDLDLVKETKNKLVKIRGIIEKQGKGYRDEANAFNKEVMRQQKEYVGILQPLEDELKEILAAEKERVEREANRELLPMKKKQLMMLNHLDPDSRFHPTDDELLDMTPEQWVAFYQEAMDENMRLMELEQNKEQIEKDRIARDEEIKKETEARLEREANEKEEQAKKEAANEKRRLARNKKRTAFLEENNFNKETDLVQDLPDGTVTIYRVVAVLKP